MKKINPLNFRGIIVIVLLALFILFIVFAAYIYFDIKKVEQGVYNLYQQIKVTNNKIDQFSVADEETAEQAMKFTEATKNWPIYQNSDYHFQFKSPAGWGNFILEKKDDKAKTPFEGERWFGRFYNLSAESDRKVVIATYNFSLAGENRFAEPGMKDSLAKNEVGECGNELFEKIKALNIGEIRNCYVKNNILNQRFIIYRYFKPADQAVPAINRLVGVYPLAHYYLTVDLSGGLAAETEYFIKSIVFLD